VSVACQDVFTRALALSDANQVFANLGAYEVLWRLNYGQGQLFTKLAQENRFFWAKRTTLPSSAGASGRTLDLSTLPVPPIERLLDKGLMLPDGTPSTSSTSRTKTRRLRSGATPSDSC
jgi:hypothetical protein